VTRTSRAGLVVLGALSALDLLAPLLTDGEHPPMSIALLVAALGLASLVLVVSAWRGARRAVWPLIALRLLSALSAVPAFFVPGVPAIAVAAASAVIVLTMAGIALVVPAALRPAVAGAR